MNERFQGLLEEYLTGNISAEGARELLDLLEVPENLRQFEALIDDQLAMGYYDQDINLTETHQRILEKLMPEKKQGKLVPMRKRVWIRYTAAAVLLFIVAATWFLLPKSEKPTPTIAYKGNVAPGKDGAILKLSDGRMIMIDTVKDGLIAMDGKVKVYKQKGQIYYEGKAQEVAYNEITTINGRQASTTLPDGSIVWLDAASSLRYPLRFTGKERLVEMTGQVAYDVIHNESQPFKVKTPTETIEDKGTEFNVNAYTDEAAMKVTLLKGSVKIKDAVLKPGEEYSNGKISKGNTEEAFAWRDGNFRFTHADLSTVMRQFARWYNVEIKYENGVIPDETFTGGMGRNLTLADALDALKKMRVHFRIEEDKRIVILK